MTINLQIGGVYADPERNDHRITHLSARGLFVSDRGYTFCANGQKYASVKSHYDLITVISEPGAPTEAPAPDGVTVTARVTQVTICAPEANEMGAESYIVSSLDGGTISLAQFGRLVDFIPMSPAAARAIGAELIRMGGE
jgi:hypothetical protein